MDWKLYDKNNQFIQEVNCQYDSLDLAVMLRDAKKVIVDFNKKETHIIE